MALRCPCLISSLTDDQLKLSGISGSLVTNAFLYFICLFLVVFFAVDLLNSAYSSSEHFFQHGRINAEVFSSGGYGDLTTERICVPDIS